MTPRVGQHVLDAENHHGRIVCVAGSDVVILWDHKGAESVDTSRLVPDENIWLVEASQ